MDSDNDCGPSTPKKKRALRNELSKEEKKRVHIKLFRKEWLEIKDYKFWLQEISNDKTKCKCVACNVVLVSGKSELAKHSEGKKHLSNIKSLRGSQNLKVLTKNIKYEDKNKDIKSAEIKLSAYFANHNIAFQAVDILTPVLQDIFKDSKVAQSLTLHRKKCTSIINNVIAPVEINELLKLLEHVPFQFWSMKALT
ncbi:uncharacterized protein LOC126899370 [Daktulosphaira vitifoliae]|uniref:uncharacterized protein LOC126899370 n=2 Tax=Daktulosphaira vitifoliae TaxID=58002 RepID=UPI0021AA54ED|nr:uncharacterized protein LOC126899370 [Daktulosphaira vitifoliae]